MSKIPLSETDQYVLFKEYEEVFLFDKNNNTDLWLASFYGEADVGWLGLVNDWAIVGGEKLLIWKNNTAKFIEDPGLTWIHAIRQTGDDEVEILTDPWSEHPAIWKLNVMTEQREKIRDFNDYKDKAYTGVVIW